MDSLASRITLGCPIRTTLEMLGGKWRLLIVNQLAAGPRRFGELRRLLPDISEKMLVQELRHLAAAELVARTNHGEVPPRVEYLLTALGHEALPVVAALAQFGSSYAAHIRASQPNQLTCSEA